MIQAMNITEPLTNVSTLANDTCLDNNCFKPYEIPALTLEWKILIPLYCLIFVLSVVGNILVILTLVQNKRMRTVTNVFLLNLAISDLFIAILCMPFNTIPLILQNFVFGKFMCISVRYLQGVFFCVGCFTLVILSLERYFAICRPLHSRKWQTLSHSYKILGICWILSFIVMIPSAINNKYISLIYGNNMCREEWDNTSFEIGYTIALLILLLVGPVVTMTIAYMLIAVTLWIGMKMDTQNELESTIGSQNGSCKKPDVVPIAKPKGRYDLQRGMRQTNSERSRASKKRVIKMLFAVVFEFFVCWTPMFIIQSWVIIDENSAELYVTNELSSAFHLLAYVSTCCNPITYCFMNRNFRQGFFSAFRCLRRQRIYRQKCSSLSYSGGSYVNTKISKAGSYERSHHFENAVESEET
ncbi:cholecystokinin receptor type A-like [Mytilus edulis]|uniref:cholecystokinin receptor type A-like n=1 Tax=Mytilus edulis TaxID=6550 RepID=UPI0039EF58BE